MRSGCAIFCWKPRAPARLSCLQVTFGESHWRLDATVTRQAKSAVVRTIWIVRTGESVPRFVTCWGAVMKVKKGAKLKEPSLLDVVALLKGLPAQRLARGQV